MKNLSLVINVVLAVAVIVLYAFHFGSSEGETNEISASEDEKPSGDFTIAYIVSDSLLANYQYVTDENAKVQRRTTQIETDIRNRAEGLQKELQDYQANYGNLTIGQARSIEEGLARKEQNLRLFQESARQELLKLESDISRELYEKVTDFLEVHSERNGIQMVVKFDTSSDVLYAGKGLDITQVVIDSLNARYLNPSPKSNPSDSTK